MLNFWYWGFVFLFFLPGNGKEVGWIWFLHGDSNEVDGGIYGTSNFLDMRTWRFRFPDGDIEAGMMASLLNNFLRPLLHFVVADPATIKRL